MSKLPVEVVARAFCVAFGRDPNQLVPATGYADAKLVPAWTLEKEWAIRCLLAMDIVGALPPPPAPVEPMDDVAW